MSITLSGLITGLVLGRVLAGVISNFVSWRDTYWMAVGLQGGTYFSNMRRNADRVSDDGCAMGCPS